MAKVKAELDTDNFGSSDLQNLLSESNNRVPLPGSKFQLLDKEGLSLDERLTVDQARELQNNLRKLMEGGDLGAVTLSDGRNVIRIPPHVVMSTLHPNDRGVERRIHEAYKNQRFIGRDFEEAEETPYSTKATFDLRTSVPQMLVSMATPLPELKSSTKRAFVVKKRKKAEALAARARQLKGQQDS